MGWQTSAPSLPSGSSYGSAKTISTKGNYWSYTATISIARLSTNQVSIRFVMDAGYGTYGETQYYPPYYYYFAVGSSTKNYTWGDKTVYWTGALNSGASVTVYSGVQNQNVDPTNIKSTTFTGPAYITTYTIAYNANGGSGAPGSQTKTYGSALTLSTTIPTRTGYTFLRWNTAADGTGTSYAAGASYTANASATLYAIWQIITYTITYKANGPSASDQTQTKNYGTAVTLKGASTFTYTNYTFQYWNTKADGTGTTYAAGASYGTNAALTLYAIWKKNNIPVYINVNGTIKQVEKAYMNVGGVIKECTVYLNVNGSIKTIV